MHIIYKDLEQQKSACALQQFLKKSTCSMCSRFMPLFTLKRTITRAPHGLKAKCDTATLKVVEIRRGVLKNCRK